MSGHGDSRSYRNTRTSNTFLGGTEAVLLRPLVPGTRRDLARQEHLSDVQGRVDTLVGPCDCEEQLWVDLGSDDSGIRAWVTVLPWSLRLLGDTVIRRGITYY